MFSSPFISGQFPRGTLVAEIGLLVTAAYYVHAWRSARDPELTGAPDTRVLLRGYNWPVSSTAEVPLPFFTVSSSLFVALLEDRRSRTATHEAVEPYRPFCSVAGARLSRPRMGVVCSLQLATSLPRTF